MVFSRTSREIHADNIDAFDVNAMLLWWVPEQDCIDVLRRWSEMLGDDVCYIAPHEFYIDPRMSFIR